MDTILYSSSLIQKLSEFKESNPDTILIEDGNKQFSVRHVFETAQDLAKGMAVVGVKQQDTIVVAMPPGFLFVSYLIAACMLNARLALIDPEMGRENYLSKLKQLNAKYAITDKRLLLLQEHPILNLLVARFKKSIPNFPHMAGMTYFTDNQMLPVLKKTYNPKTIVNLGKTSTIQWKIADENSDAFIVYTSGTTKTPKGVLHSPESFNASLKSISSLIDLKGLRIGVKLPHFVFLAIAAEAKAVIMPSFRNGKAYFEFILQNKIEVLFGPPSEFMPILEHCRANQLSLPKTLKYILLGSAPVHPPFLKKLITLTDISTKIYCIYGMTEHLLTAICDGRIKAEDKSDSDLLGAFVPGIEYKIEEDGELLIRSKQMFKRYYHLKDGPSYHATGDLVTVKDNLLYLTGRKKNMIIRRNFNLYPELYEHTIMKIDGVREALMLGVYDQEMHDEKVMLLIDGNISKEKLVQELLRGQCSIDKEAIPDEVIFTPIPHSGRQRKADRALAIEIVNSYRP